MIELHNRVIAKRDIERYPYFTFPAGTKGTVVEVTPAEVAIKLDTPIKGAEEWGNCVMYYMENQPEHQAEILEDWAQLYYFDVEMFVNFYYECTTKEDAIDQAKKKIASGTHQPDLNNYDVHIQHVDTWKRRPE